MRKIFIDPSNSVHFIRPTAIRFNGSLKTDTTDETLIKNGWTIKGI